MTSLSYVKDISDSPIDTSQSGKRTVVTGLYLRSFLSAYILVSETAGVMQSGSQSKQVMLSHKRDGGCQYSPPVPQSPSLPQGITAHWPLPNFTACWQRQVGASNLPKVAPQQCTTGNRTRDLRLASPTTCALLCHYATPEPTQHLGIY